MALKYVVKKTVFGFDITHTARYVARPLPAGTVSYTDLCDQVAKAGLAPNELVKQLLDILIDTLRIHLMNHMSVKLDDFGTLRPSFGCKSQDDEKAVDEQVLLRRKIIFTPSKKFKNLLTNVSMNKGKFPV